MKIIISENKKQKLIEELSRLEHEQWEEWSKDIAEKEDISKERLNRWKKYWVDYNRLDDKEKNDDREWAERALSIFEKYGSKKEHPKYDTLEKNKVPLTDEERKEVMGRGAIWHHGPGGAPSPAVWKADVDGKNWYICNTHRAWRCKPTLKGAINDYDFIETTAQRK